MKDHFLNSWVSNIIVNPLHDNHELDTLFSGSSLEVVIFDFEITRSKGGRQAI